MFQANPADPIFVHAVGGAQPLIHEPKRTLPAFCASPPCHVHIKMRSKATTQCEGTTAKGLGASARRSPAEPVIAAKA